MNQLLTNLSETKWKEKYLALIKKVALKNEEFSADTVRQAFERSRIGYLKRQAFAPMFRKALRLGIMERTGRCLKPRTRNSVPLQVYQSCIFKQTEKGE